MSVQTVEVQAPILNAHHRCDACASSRAYVAVILRWSPTLRQGGELLFCGHCYRKAEQAIQPFISVLIDERWTLTKHVEDDKHVN